MTDLDEGRIATLLRTLPGEPPHDITSSTVVQAARSRRRRRAVTATVCAALVATIAVGLVAARPEPRAAQPARPALGRLCPLDEAQVPQEQRLSAGTRVAAVVDCSAQVVRRPGEGWWLQVSERDATFGIDQFVEAVRGLEPSTGLCASTGGGMVNRPAPPAVPTLVLDVTGRLRQVLLPQHCSAPTAAVQAAAAGLTWRAPSARWVRQVLPESEGAAACVGTFVSLARTYWPLHPAGSAAGHVNASSPRRGQVCVVLSPGPAGPRASDFVDARWVTDPVERARAVAALDATTGIQGPDPTGWQGAPAGSMPIPQPCRTPTTHPYEVLSGGAVIGYADLSLCLKAAGPDLGAPSALLFRLVEEFETNPYEQ